jgi:hypothetical protein
MGIPPGWNISMFLIFHPIFDGTVGFIIMDTENKVNTIIFGNVEITISYKNTYVQYVVYTTKNT